MSLTPAPASRRVLAPSSRLSTDVKSALCRSLKWLVLDDHFSLKVPLREKAAIDYLKQHAGEPSAQYIDVRSAGRDALQWRLPLAKYRAVYRAAGKEVVR